MLFFLNIILLFYKLLSNDWLLIIMWVVKFTKYLSVITVNMCENIFSIKKNDN